MGGAFVYAGTYTAPSHRPHTAIGLAVIVGLLLGATIAATLIIVPEPDYWGLWQGVCVLIGAGAAAMAIATEGVRGSTLVRASFASA